MRKVLVEVKFKVTNEIKSFEATAISFWDALKECYKMIERYDPINEFEVLCILKVTF